MTTVDNKHGKLVLEKDILLGACHIILMYAYQELTEWLEWMIYAQVHRNISGM